MIGLQVARPFVVGLQRPSHHRDVSSFPVEKVTYGINSSIDRYQLLVSILETQQ